MAKPCVTIETLTIRNPAVGCYPECELTVKTIKALGTAVHRRKTPLPLANQLAQAYLTTVSFKIQYNPVRSYLLF